MEKLYRIEKPNISKINLGDILLAVNNDKRIFDCIKRTEIPEYLHWKDLKNKNWIPEIFKDDKIKFWALVKFFRGAGQQKSKIRDEQNKHFTWKKLDHYEKLFHEIDLDMSRYLLNFPEVSESDRKKYQVNGIIEEAIASSQLEGAHTTRRVAKQMIQEKRKPATHAEKMIYNNYVTMRAIQEKYKDQKMSLDMLMELHRILAQNTMNESEQGKFRQPTDEIVIQKGDDPTVISYIAPPVDFVKTEIRRFIDFANDDGDDQQFIHPIIKAIMLHFWMGFLHPFVDGNGRLARCLFYWYLLRKDYWAFAFLPISIAIKKAPAKYSEAYIMSEQDDNDLTYFIDYHIKRIIVAIQSFRAYIKEKVNESKVIDKMLIEHKELNRRQTKTLAEFRKNTDKLLTVSSYTRHHEITKATAIKDLRLLLKLGYLSNRRQGRNVFYFPTDKIDKMGR